MLFQLTWYLLFPWWVIWSFNASSALTMQENERFEIDSFTFTSQKRLQRCQKWFLHNQQEYLSPFHLDLIDWCQFCSAINYNFFFFFFMLLNVKGISAGWCLFLLKLENLQILYSPPLSKIYIYLTRWTIYFDVLPLLWFSKQ
jgi:hypothetical protein